MRTIFAPLIHTALVRSSTVYPEEAALDVPSFPSLRPVPTHLPCKALRRRATDVACDITNGLWRSSGVGELTCRPLSFRTHTRNATQYLTPLCVSLFVTFTHEESEKYCRARFASPASFLTTRSIRATIVYWRFSFYLYLRFIL